MSSMPYNQWNCAPTPHTRGRRRFVGALICNIASMLGPYFTNCDATARFNSTSHMVNMTKERAHMHTYLQGELALDEVWWSWRCPQCNLCQTLATEHSRTYTLRRTSWKIEHIRRKEKQFEACASAPQCARRVCVCVCVCVNSRERLLQLEEPSPATNSDAHYAWHMRDWMNANACTACVGWGGSLATYLQHDSTRTPPAATTTQVPRHHHRFVECVRVSHYTLCGMQMYALAAGTFKAGMCQRIHTFTRVTS